MASCNDEVNVLERSAARSKACTVVGGSGHDAFAPRTIRDRSALAGPIAHLSGIL